MSDARKLTRRRFVGAAAGVAGGAALGGSGCSTGSGDPQPSRAGTAPARRRGELNVLLLVIDSVRPDFVGAYGAQRVRTPSIDSLAAKGVRFTRCFPEAMPTLPARRAILTGRHIFPFRGWREEPPLGRGPGSAGIDDLAGTFTSILKRAGYWTGSVTDNPFLGFTKPYDRYRHGFDAFASVRGHVGTLRDPDTVPADVLAQRVPSKVRDERFIEGVRRYLANTGLGMDDSKSNAARVYRTASDMLEQAARNEPFALLVDSFDPHEPWTPTREYIDMYGDPDYRGADPAGALYWPAEQYLTPAELRRMRAVYAAELTITDKWLGTFLERFHELGLHESTAIVLLSDHGFLLGERGWTGKIAQELHPELIHVPLVVIHPDHPGSGRTSPYFASTHDVAPTLLSMAGVEPPAAMDGTDLSVAFRGEDPPARPFAYGGYFNHFFVRDDRWSFVADTRGEERELYDLDADPAELRNVADEHPDVHEQLYGALLEQVGGPLPYFR